MHIVAPVRLSGGASTQSFISGTVEVLVNGTWGAVCYRNINYGYTFARIVCRQLGFEYQSYGVLTYTTQKSASGWNNVYCTGWENSIFHCYRDVTPFGGRCSYNQLFAVACYRGKIFPKTFNLHIKFLYKFKPELLSHNRTICTGVPGGIRMDGYISHNHITGQVEVYYNHQWYEVVYDDWDIKDATVACRQLGYDYVASSSSSSSYNYQTAFYNLTCNGTEKSLFDCTHSGFRYHSWAYLQFARVSCGIGRLFTMS